jgi:hypothetical protein
VIDLPRDDLSGLQEIESVILAVSRISAKAFGTSGIVGLQFV